MFSLCSYGQLSVAGWRNVNLIQRFYAEKCVISLSKKVGSSNLLRQVRSTLILSFPHKTSHQQHPEPGPGSKTLRLYYEMA